MSNLNYAYDNSCGKKGGMYKRETSCAGDTEYAVLRSTTHFDCGPKCTCSFNSERSVKDKLDYLWYVENKPINLNNLNIPPKSC